MMMMPPSLLGRLVRGDQANNAVAAAATFLVYLLVRGKDPEKARRGF
jgi:hypothetical protein